MNYEKIVAAKFIDRPNRFIANVVVNEDGQEVKTRVHVKNTGRCRELLPSGAKVFLEDFYGRMGTRKMRYSLIAVEKERKEGNLIINMDSQAPNKVVYEALLSGKIKPCHLGALTEIKPEKTFGKSRFDFYVKDIYGKEAFIEVKGVTLENDGVARFPDAPTERGVKHIEHLIMAKEQGFEAMILFVIQMKEMDRLEPNWITHDAFGKALVEAKRAGVEIKAWDCKASPDSLEIDQEIPVVL